MSGSGALVLASLATSTSSCPLAAHGNSAKAALSAHRDGSGSGGARGESRLLGTRLFRCHVLGQTHLLPKYVRVATWGTGKGNVFALGIRDRGRLEDPSQTVRMVERCADSVRLVVLLKD